MHSFANLLIASFKELIMKKIDTNLYEIEIEYISTVRKLIRVPKVYEDSKEIQVAIADYCENYFHEHDYELLSTDNHTPSVKLIEDDYETSYDYATELLAPKCSPSEIKDKKRCEIDFSYNSNIEFE